MTKSKRLEMPGSEEKAEAENAHKYQRFDVVRKQLEVKQRRLLGREKVVLAGTIDQLVANRIRLRRIEIGVTQKWLAEQIGVTSQQVHKYETGVSRTTAGRLSQIAEALGSSVNDLSGFRCNPDKQAGTR